ncbi:MAG: thioredoxin domain-containing protein [Candidatus Gracilibacteria bacterium]|nr:thioredoxin domain-containing protein [Candidatus Gracilibacteria bacterium]
MSHKHNHGDNHHTHNPEEKNNTNILMFVIIGLLVVIAIGAFFLGKTMNTGISNTEEKTITEVESTEVQDKVDTQVTTKGQGNAVIPKEEVADEKVSNNTETINETPQDTPKVVADGIKIKVYEDKRCSTCNTDGIIESLKGVPGLSNASFTRADFYDDGISDYLKKSNITTLPAFIFPTNFVDPGIKSYLQSIGGGQYSLNVGSEFNPFLKRNAKGNLVLEASDLKLLKNETTYTRGNEDSDIAWFEYTNFVCSACIGFHKSGIHDTIVEKYGNKMKYASKHFHFELGGNDPYPSAELTECAAEQLGSKGFYALEKNVFVDGIRDIDTLTQKAVALGANKTKLESCIKSKSALKTLDSVKDNGARIFGVSATPTNILVNLKTGEYMKTQNIASDLEIFMGK